MSAAVFIHHLTLWFDLPMKIFFHFLFYNNKTRSYLSSWFIITTPAIASNLWYLWSMNAFMINTKAAGSLSKLNRSIITFVSTQISLKCFGRFCVPFFLFFFLMENVSFKLYLFAFLIIVWTDDTDLLDLCQHSFYQCKRAADSALDAENSVSK